MGNPALDSCGGNGLSVRYLGNGSRACLSLNETSFHVFTAFTGDALQPDRSELSPYMICFAIRVRLSASILNSWDFVSINQYLVDRTLCGSDFLDNACFWIWRSLDARWQARRYSQWHQVGIWSGGVVLKVHTNQVCLQGRLGKLLVR